MKTKITDFFVKSEVDSTADVVNLNLLQPENLLNTHKPNTNDQD